MPDLDANVDFLARVPLFQGLKRRQIDNLASSMVSRRFAAGETIVTQGKEGIGLFVLVSGQAEVVRTGLDGSTVILNTFGPTDFFGELALLDDGPRTASVVTTEATKCLVLTRWDFYGALREDVEMSITILEEMARRFRVALDSL